MKKLPKSNMSLVQSLGYKPISISQDMHVLHKSPWDFKNLEDTAEPNKDLQLYVTKKI